MNTERRTWAYLMGLAVLVGSLALAGCSSSSPASGSTSTTPTASNSAPMVITVSDAPLSNILSAKVTISALALTPSTGGASISVLSKPETVELSGLGAVQEPLEIANLAFGTYNAVSVTVSAADVTYVDSTGKTVTASATVSGSAVTVALTPPLTVSNQGELHLRVAFNLAQSFSITGTTITFTPALNTGAAAVSSESDGDRKLEVSGSVVSINSSSITVQSADSGKQFQFAIQGTTQFSNGASASSIQAGQIVEIVGQTQSDGTLLAQTITVDGGQSGQEHDGAKGIITSVSQNSAGAVTAFTMVPRENFGAAGSNGALNVAVTSSTVLGIPEGAQQVGIAASSFTLAEIFPGQSVMVTGAVDSTGTLNAQQIMLAAESIPGALAGTPQGSNPNYTFALTIPVPSFLTTFAKTVTLNVATSQNTEYGNGLTATSFASLTAASNLEVHGFLLVDSQGNYTLYATEIAQSEAPEQPEGGD